MSILVGLADKYSDCLSCHTTKNLVSFSIGNNSSSRALVTLCKNCIREVETELINKQLSGRL